MACGCVSQRSAILYIFFILYLHYSTYKNIFSIVDLPEAYKDKPKVDFYPENLHIAVIPHFIAKPRAQNCTPIQFLLKEVEFDILGVTETHLTEDIPNELIRIHGYNMVRTDRSNGSKGCGVVIHYRDNLNICCI